MARNRAEERQALSSFETWRLARPSAGIILGTVKINLRKGCADVQFAHVDCCPTSLVAAASELLNAANEKLRAGILDDEVWDLIGSIEQARAALDFEERGVAQ